VTPERQFPVSRFSLDVDGCATRIQIAVFATNPRPLRNPHVSRGAPLPCETFTVPQAVQEKLSGRPHAQDSICWFRSGLRLVIMCHLRWPIESGIESLAGCPALTVRSLRYREKDPSGEQKQAGPRRGLSSTASASTLAAPHALQRGGQMSMVQVGPWPARRTARSIGRPYVLSTAPP
jgi:hypothetical protein